MDKMKEIFFLQVPKGGVFSYRGNQYIKCEVASVSRKVITQSGDFTLPPKEVNCCSLRDGSLAFINSHHLVYFCDDEKEGE